jgi:hypothetical protein
MRGLAAHGVLLALLIAAPALAQEPPLPAGLGDEPKQEEPELPAGLGSPSEEPGLPAGLGKASEEPGLPAGLGEEEAPDTLATDDDTNWRDKLPTRLSGFWETRFGVRTGSDPNQSKDVILGETRLQLETRNSWDRVELDTTTDFFYDGVYGGLDLDLRQLRLTWVPFDAMDIRVGRQVLTWGTGDLVFINDLFPKDWVSFLAGRDVEYLKAPSDAIKVGLFTDWVNIDFVYTPQFNHDRYITGNRVSYYNPLFGRTGDQDDVDVDVPHDWFEDDEFAWRLYRNFGTTEVAVYGYSGYWKSPGGQKLLPMRATFPKLSVYGASARRPLFGGIANIEVGYYDSRQDRGGDNPFINNSEIRLLLGYERELAKEFTGAFQYYLEHMMDYDAYRNTLPFLIEPKDENRHVLTARFTKLLMDQNMTLSLFTFYSPSDNDAYLRPKASYKITDRWLIEGGANIFVGENDYTFYNQFEDNTNVYAGVRYSF